MVAIKQLGTNGGGFFGPNSAHPYENPTPISNLAETWSITIIPMAMVWTLGEMLRRRRLAVVIFLTMLALYLPLVSFAVVAGGWRQPGDCGDGRRPVDRLDGGQGSALRRRPFGALGVDDHGHLERLGQQHARLDDAARRPRADDRDVAQQHLRRRRRRLHQHADLHHRHRLRRRHDDRPHAGVPRQEGRSQGDEARERGAAARIRCSSWPARRSPATSGRRRPIPARRSPG